MARVAKIDNVWKKRFDREENRRKTEIRKKLVYFLIVSEGEKTEPNYFLALRKKLPPNTVELKIEGTGHNTISLVNYAIKYCKDSCRKFDRVWVVFDKDDFPDENFNGAILKASSNNIKTAWSNEAFELWFLLHFQYINNGMNRDDYKAYLEREIKRKSGNSNYVYLKNDPDTYSLLETFGNQKQAIQWAYKLKNSYTDQRFSMHNPCTLVYELISELTDPSVLLKELDNN